MIVEYCQHGCLRNYLVKNRASFVDTLDSCTTTKPPPSAVQHQAISNDYINTPQPPVIPASQHDLNVASSTSPSTLTTKDLVCFAFQIARGMEYLASRNVSGYARYILRTAGLFRSLQCFGCLTERSHAACKMLTSTVPTYSSFRDLRGLICGNFQKCRRTLHFNTFFQVALSLRVPECHHSGFYWRAKGDAGAFLWLDHELEWLST